MESNSKERLQGESEPIIIQDLILIAFLRSIGIRPTAKSAVSVPRSNMSGPFSPLRRFLSCPSPGALASTFEVPMKSHLCFVFK